MKALFANLGKKLTFIVFYWISILLLTGITNAIKIEQLFGATGTVKIALMVLIKCINSWVCIGVTYWIVCKLFKQPMKLSNVAMACAVACITLMIPAFMATFGYAENSWILDVIIPLCSCASLFNEKKPKKTGEETTLYQKERIIQKGSKAAEYRVVLIVILWIAGFIGLFSGMIPVGMILLAAAFLWTKQLIDRNRIESYQKIVTPSHWPKDCQYASYGQGLRPVGGGASFSTQKFFYLRCIKEGVNDLNSPAGKQKALLIAQQMKLKDLSEEGIRTAYADGKLAVEKDAVSSSSFAREQALAETRIAELQVLAGAMKYYGLHGREKRIAMLTDMRDEAKKSMRKEKAMQSYAEHSMLKKEHDWAIHGGIASGIAGPAAGLVAAMRVEAKNAAIREYNAQMAPYAMLLSQHYAGSAASYEALKEKYEADIRSTAVKLVADDPTQKVYEHLRIDNMTYAVSETGAVVVEADFDIDKNYRIFDSVAPAIDGIVAVRLTENDQPAGSAYFVLPVDGVHKKVRLASICTKTTDPDAQYKMAYEPVDLWAIEKL